MNVLGSVLGNSETKSVTANRSKITVRDNRSENPATARITILVTTG